MKVWGTKSFLPLAQENTYIYIYIIVIIIFITTVINQFDEN